METQSRNSGIDVVGAMPWGTHFCHFYDTKDDLLETLVPYFATGLKSGEFCLWVVSDVTEQDALIALRRAVSDFDRHLNDRSIEVISDREWYLDGDTFDFDRVIRGWKEKLAEALNRGYPGMRAAGGTCWLQRKWTDFSAYEEHLHESITNLLMTCMCSYPVAASGAAEVLDVVRTHQFTVARRNGNWEVLETPEIRQAKSEIARLNDALERRVIERTAELSAVNEQLRLALQEVNSLRQRLESENAYLREEAKEASGRGPITGKSPAIRHVLEQVDVVAPTDAAVLILGETGVGKELVARAIHEGSPRSVGPLIKVNCTAIPRELFESEFFGHVKGAFSGALKDRMGRFQLADGGTLFLDEVGDLPPQMQPKLLRVLEEGEFEPVGHDQTRRANVRLIAATNHDLSNMVLNGQFREDLYYRLSVFPIEVPPLREHKEDIPLLAAHFLELACPQRHRARGHLGSIRIATLRSAGYC